jgi:hypothetical protein
VKSVHPVGFIIKKFVHSYFIFKTRPSFVCFSFTFLQTHTPSAAKSILQNVYGSKATVGWNGVENKGIQFIKKGGRNFLGFPPT